MTRLEKFSYHTGNLRCLIREHSNLFPTARRRVACRHSQKLALGYVGWIGYANLGDEAMLQAVRRLFSDCEVLHFAGPVKEYVLARANLSGQSFFSAVLLGGGTLVNPLYLGLMRTARRLGAPLYTFGTGVGSCGFAAPPEVGLEGWKEMLRHFPLISVRGPLSRDALHAIGVERITVIGDPALSLAPDAPPERRTRRRLVINLAQHPDHAYAAGDFALFRSVERIAKQFARDGGEVVGVALGGGDFSVLKRFRHEAGLPQMRIENHRTSVEGFFRTIEGSMGLIGVRLHSAVLASCAGVPSVLLSYRSKCEDFMTSMDMLDFSVPLSAGSGEMLEARWSQLLEEPEWGEKAYRMAQHWKQKQMAYARELLKELQ